MIVVLIEESDSYYAPAHMSSWRCTSCAVRGQWRLGFGEGAILRTIKLGDKHRCNEHVRCDWCTRKQAKRVNLGDGRGCRQCRAWREFRARHESGNTSNERNA